MNSNWHSSIEAQTHVGMGKSCGCHLTRLPLIATPFCLEPKKKHKLLQDSGCCFFHRASERLGNRQCLKIIVAMFDLGANN